MTGLLKSNSKKKLKKEYISLWNRLYEEGKGNKYRHKMILDHVYKIMEDSCEYKVLRDRMPYPTDEIKNILCRKEDVGEIDILGLDSSTGNLVDIEIKSNGMTLAGAVEQLRRANEWIFENRNLVEKNILRGKSFEGIDNMVCYMFSDRLIFHDVDINLDYCEGLDPEAEWDDYLKKNEWKKDYESLTMGNYNEFDEKRKILKIFELLK